jgi:hypothetical protein
LSFSIASPSSCLRAAPAQGGTGRKGNGEAEGLSAAVERHLSEYFSNYRDIELAHVAGPAVALELLHRVAVELLARQALALDQHPLAAPAQGGTGRKGNGEAEGLSAAVERHLSEYFSSA